jgi:dipeptidyl-peptidase-4
MQIDLYDFASLNKTATLIDTKDHILPRIDSYTFDGEENDILCNSNQIFRHSFTADYYLYNIAKELTKLFDFQVQEPTFLLMEKRLPMLRKIIFMFMI